MVATNDKGPTMTAPSAGAELAEGLLGSDFDPHAFAADLQAMHEQRLQDLSTGLEEFARTYRRLEHLLVADEFGREALPVAMYFARG